MTDEITLHRLGPEDFDRLMEIPEGLFDKAMDPKQARAFLRDPLHEGLLAYSGGVAVGMVTGTILLHPDKPPSMFVNELGTRTAYQRRGIATRLVRAMIAVARERGCKGVWLGTEADNHGARALYQSLGAEELPVLFYGWDDAF